MAGRGGESSAEPSEPPTARRLEDARRRGELALSPALGAGAALAAIVALLVASGPAAVSRLVSYFGVALSGATKPGTTVAAAAGGGFDVAVSLLALPLGAAFAVTLGSGLLQTGARLSRRPAGAFWGRLSFASVRASLFGARAAGALFKQGFAIAVIGALAWLTLRPIIPALARLAQVPARQALETFGVVAARLGLRIALAALALGIADGLWVRHQHARSLRMTRHERKQELRETEGDAAHRALRRRLQRELAAERAVEDLRHAALVVAGADGSAVALAYQRGGPAAPVVLLKGERLAGERIQRLAREAGVAVAAHATLAHALLALGEGEEIPPRRYEEVAELLKTVYDSKRPEPS